MPQGPFRNFFYLVLLGGALMAIAIVVRTGWLAREDPGTPINSAMREALEDGGNPQLSTRDAELIAERYGTAHRLPSGLRYIERDRGTGVATPVPGDSVVVHYVGRLLDGTQFDSSYDKGTPLSFRVGVGQVIKGWDEAFLSMHKGEKRTLIVPYWLGYGVSGEGPIPPRATLVFEVELLDFR